MLSSQFVDNKELRKQIGALNGTGLFPEVMKSVGVKRDELVKMFLAAVDSIPVGSEEEKKIPQSVIEFYNSIVEGTDPSPEEIAEKAKKKEKKPAKEKGPNFEQRAYDLVKSMEGKTEEEIKAAALAMYTELYLKRDPESKPEFIQGRTNIYLKIANKRIAKENAPADTTEKEEVA